MKLWYLLKLQFIHYQMYFSSFLNEAGLSLFGFWRNWMTETQTKVFVSAIYFFVFLSWFNLFHIFGLFQLLDNVFCCFEGYFWRHVIIDFRIAFSFAGLRSFWNLIKWSMKVIFLLTFSVVENSLLDIVYNGLLEHLLT